MCGWPPGFTPGKKAGFPSPSNYQTLTASQQVIELWSTFPALDGAAQDSLTSHNECAIEDVGCCFPMVEFFQKNCVEPLCCQQYVSKDDSQISGKT